MAARHLRGHHEEDSRHADLVVVNPAVRPGDRFAGDRPPQRRGNDPGNRALSPGLPGPDHWRDRFQREIDDGRHDRQSAGGRGRRTWLGGNIGRSLLDDVRSHARQRLGRRWN